MFKLILISALCISMALAAVDKIDADKVGVELKRVSKREALVVSEQPLNVTEWPVNPCDTARSFNYYMPHPNDTRRYIECDPWGTGKVKTCAEGTIWDMWSLCCMPLDKVHNVSVSALIIPQRVFNCSLSGHECQNRGVCTESTLGGDRCVCKPDWTGPMCESRVDTNDLVHEILNGTFSIHRFRDHLATLNITVDVSQYMRYRDQLDNTTFTALMDYMNLYKGREVRYDTLINNLIEAVLEDIYPDAAYLSTFNASTVSVVDLVQLIPNLMSYSKYSLERYEDVFAKYQQVLGRLIVHLNGSHAHLRNEATQYTRLTGIFMNQTLSLINQTQGSSTIQNSENVNSLLNSNRQDGHAQWSEDQIRESLRTQFNATLNATRSLFAGLEGFERDVAVLMQNNTADVYKMTLQDSKLNGTVEIQNMLQQISTSSVHIWEQLVDYGFWYTTSVLCGPSVVQQIAPAIVAPLATELSSGASLVPNTV